MIFDKRVFKRVVLEGHRAWHYRGPNRVNPYGRDPRNGAWSFGAQQAKRGFSEAQAWRAFCEMEYDRLPQDVQDLTEVKEPEPMIVEDRPPLDLIPKKSRRYFNRMYH